MFKNLHLIIFQFSFQTKKKKKFTHYNKDIFADRTFYVVPKFNYHVFITGNYVPELNRFYSTSFSILKKIRIKLLLKYYLNK